MKKALRIVALLMAVVMVLGTFAACGGGSETKEPATEAGKTNTPTTGGKTEAPESGTSVPTARPDPTQVEIPAKVQEAIDDQRFAGENIGIVVSGGSFATRSIYVDKEADDYDPTYSVNVAVESRNARVEKALGIKIVGEKTVGMQGMTEYIRNHFSSPTVDLDIVGVYQYFDIGLAFGDFSGSFVNYSKLSEQGDNYLNLDAPYWDKGLYETLEWDGNAFWITGDLSQMWISSAFVSFVNARIWGEYMDDIEEHTGYSDIYELVYAGKWTLDLILWLNETVHKNLDGNDSAVTLKDQHGFLSYTKATGINSIVVDALFSGSHVTWTEYEADGTPKIKFYDKELVTYATKIATLYNESKSCLIDYDGETGDQVVNRFADGNTLVTLNILSDAETYLGDMQDDYYIIPLPKLDDASEYSTTVGDGVTQFGIPTTCTNMAAASATLELLGYYSYQEVTPVYYNEVLKGRYVRGDSNDAAEMIDFIRTTIYSDFALIWSNTIASYGSTESPSWFMRYNIGAKNMPTLGRSKERSWQRGVDKLINDLEMAGVEEI